MNQIRQNKNEFSETSSAIFKGPHLNHGSPPSDSTSKGAHQDSMLRKKPEIKRLLREEEE